MNLQRMFLVALTISTLTQAHIEPRAVLKTAAALKTKLHLLKAEGDIHWLVKNFIEKLDCSECQAKNLAEMCRQILRGDYELASGFAAVMADGQDAKRITRSIVLTICDMLADPKVVDVVVSNLKNANKFVRRCKKETIKRNPALKAELETDKQFFRNIIAIFEQRKAQACAVFKAKAQELRARTEEITFATFVEIIEALNNLCPEVQSDKWIHYFPVAMPCQKCQKQFNALSEAAKKSYLKLIKTAEKAFAKKTR